MGRRRRRWGRNDPDLPKMEAFKGDVIGARLLGVAVHEEGIIAMGAVSERWRLTDNIDALLLPDDEFILGGSIEEVREVLEFRHPSPVPGASMVEVCNKHDLKRHTMPFGDPAISTRRHNPQYAQYRWGEEYVTTWLPGVVEILTRLCITDNVLVSAMAAEYLREEDDFDGSDLVISRRDAWYSVVKYWPSKAGARRKGRKTISKKAQHAVDLVAAGRDLRAHAAAAYIALRDELDDCGVTTALADVERPDRYGNDSGNTKLVVGQLRALLRIHAALLGKHAYRYNDPWHSFLKAVRDRPKDLNDYTWGYYEEYREWLAAECLIRKPKPTKKMLAAAAASAAAALKARTCAACGRVQDDVRGLHRPPDGFRAEHAPGVRLCIVCWEAEFNAIADENEQPSLAAAN